MSTFNLELGSTRFSFRVKESAENAFNPIRRFFQHSESSNVNDRPDVRVTVSSLDPLYAQELQLRGVPVVIRRSSAVPFNFDAFKVSELGRIIYANDTTLIDVPSDLNDTTEISLGISNASTVQVIDFLRDTALRLEETKGTVVLHASAIRSSDGVVAIAGPKGAGKTTSMLASLKSERWEYFSGDKLLCYLADDGIYVQAWRDFPYVGVGTLRQHRRLADQVTESLQIDLDDFTDEEKLLLDPDLFESWIGAQFTAARYPLIGVLSPTFSVGNKSQFNVLTTGAARWRLMNQIIDRTSDTTFFGWQDFFVPDYSRMFATLSSMRRFINCTRSVEVSGNLSDLFDIDAYFPPPSRAR